MNPVAHSPPRSLAALVEEHQEALVHFLTKRLGSAEEAEDVAQEAYLRLMKVEHLEELASPRGYLFRTAANLAVDRIRQRTRLARQRQQVALQARSEQGGPGSPDAASPESEFQARERVDQAAEVLRRLPEKCRCAFILHRIQGLSHAEIGRELGVSRKMVEKYVSRALGRLRKRLRPEKW